MNVIRKSIDEVKYRIPKAILEKVFLNYGTYNRYVTPTSIDDQLLNLVIKARVLVDCNLIGGTQAMIPLSGLAFNRTDLNETVINIPKSRTQGKSINSVLNVAFVSPTSTSAGMGFGSFNSSNSMMNGSALMGSTKAALAAFDNIPLVSTAKAQLLGENTVLIRDNIVINQNCYLRCILANDEELSNIQLRSYKNFAKLVEFATKSYIYNNLIVEIDQGQLQGGVNLSIIKEIISNYADAEQNYQDYLRDVWEVVAYMNDSPSYSRHMKLVIGSNR
jgi:hypothetical protein